MWVGCNYIQWCGFGLNTEVLRTHLEFGLKLHYLQVNCNWKDAFKAALLTPVLYLAAVSDCIFFISLRTSIRHVQVTPACFANFLLKSGLKFVCWFFVWSGRLDMNVCIVSDRYFYMVKTITVFVRKFCLVCIKPVKLLTSFSMKKWLDNANWKCWYLKKLKSKCS